MTARALVNRVRTSVTAKVCFFVALTEILLLAGLGVLFSRSYSRELERALAEKMSLPAVLMAQLAMNFESVTDLPALGEIVQEPVVEAFVARREGTIFYASEPGAIGRDYRELLGPRRAPAFPERPSRGSAPPGALAKDGQHFSLLAPLTVGGEAIGVLYLKVDGRGVVAKERRVALLLVLGAGLTVVLTNLIAGFWLNRLLVPRIARTVAVLQEVKDGRYSTRLSDTGAPDQVGNLMLNVNAMIAQIDVHTANLRALASCGEELASARSRGEAQQALVRVIGARFAAVPGGVCRLAGDGAAQEIAAEACVGLSPEQAAAVAAGELLLAGKTGTARVFLPVVEPARSGQAVWFELAPGPDGEAPASEIFLRMLGRLLADAVGRIDAAADQRRAERAESERNAAEAAMRAKSEMLALLEAKNLQLETALEELRLAQARLVQSEKMVAMGTMAAGVAHDLNNILSGIVSYPDLLLLQVPQESPLRESLEVIRESGVRAAAVVADLLTIARGAAYPTEPCDLNRLIERLLLTPECRQLERRYPGVRIERRLAADLRPTDCSWVHMQKVAMNLIVNACEAIRGPGSVLITTENVDVAAGEAGTRSVPPGPYVAMKVADTGPGIPAEDLDRIFEPFFSKKILGRSGTGLGLAVVWNSVHEHGGTVFVESGQSGAVFTVLLPASAEAPAGGAPPEPSRKDLRGSGSVLVVDDESQLRHIATRILTALGYRAQAVSSGEEAVAYLRERPVDVLLLDMIMPPGMGGAETYREIVKLRPGQKAVLCSGYAESEDCLEAQEAGAGGFLKKPYSLEELALAVKRELERPG